MTFAAYIDLKLIASVFFFQETYVVKQMCFFVFFLVLFIEESIILYSKGAFGAF